MRPQTGQVCGLPRDRGLNGLEVLLACLGEVAGLLSFDLMECRGGDGDALKERWLSPRIFRLWSVAARAVNVSIEGSRIGYCMPWPCEEDRGSGGKMAERGVGGAMDASVDGSIGAVFMMVLIPGKVMLLEDGRIVGCLSEDDKESSKMEDMRGNDGEEGGVKRDPEPMSSPLRTRRCECAIVWYIDFVYLVFDRDGYEQSKVLRAGEQKKRERERERGMIIQRRRRRRRRRKTRTMIKKEKPIGGRDRLYIFEGFIR